MGWSKKRLDIIDALGEESRAHIVSDRNGLVSENRLHARRNLGKDIPPQRLLRATGGAAGKSESRVEWASPRALPSRRSAT